MGHPMLVWSNRCVAHDAVECMTAVYCRVSAGKAEDSPLASGAVHGQPRDAAAVAEAALTLAAAIGPQIGKPWLLCNVFHADPFPFLPYNQF